MVAKRHNRTVYSQHIAFTAPAVVADGVKMRRELFDPIGPVSFGFSFQHKGAILVPRRGVKLNFKDARFVVLGKRNFDNGGIL